MRLTNISVWHVALVAIPIASGEDPATVRADRVRPTRYSLQRDSDEWWLVSPTGDRFFSLGVCQLGMGTPREQYQPDRPCYAGWRHYDTSREWADASLQRLKGWGFNVVGGWSDLETLHQSRTHDLGITPVLHLGSTVGFPWLDMWDEGHLRRLDELARSTIVPMRNDHRVIGYYSDNELGWWNAMLWKMALQQPASSGQRQRLLRMLREWYRDDWHALQEDFEAEDAASWKELEQAGMLWLRPGSRGVRTMRRFLELMADRYYQLMRDAITKYDSDALFLGDRYQSFYYPEVARASGAYVDVSSTNLNVHWNDGTFARSYLDTLSQLVRRPVLVSEFYMSARENRSGNPNSDGSFPVVETQRERAAASQATLRSLVRLPYVIGAEWFQYYDEPPHGRYDGEDFNFGLVDISDRPYEELTAAIAALDLTKLKAHAHAPAADVSDGLPPAPADPFGNFVFKSALQHWDRQRGYLRPASEFPVADLYACWSTDALYLGIHALDLVETAYYRGPVVPHADRAIWTLRFDRGNAITVRLGGGQPPKSSDHSVRVQSLSGTNHTVNCLAIMQLPAEQLGKPCLETGQQVKYESTFVSHGGAYRIEWQGEFTLRE
jgi:hypothetical protein